MVLRLMKKIALVTNKKKKKNETRKTNDVHANVETDTDNDSAPVIMSAISLGTGIMMMAMDETDDNVIDATTTSLCPPPLNYKVSFNPSSRINSGNRSKAEDDAQHRTKQVKPSPLAQKVSTVSTDTDDSDNVNTECNDDNGHNGHNNNNVVMNQQDKEKILSLIESIETCWKQYQDEQQAEQSPQQRHSNTAIPPSSVSNMIVGSAVNSNDNDNANNDDDDDNNSNEPMDMNCYETIMKGLLQDKKHLLRILIARQYDIQKSTMLFYEQVRFQTKFYKPKQLLIANDEESIKKTLIPNAYKCKFNLFWTTRR